MGRFSDSINACFKIMMVGVFDFSLFKKRFYKWFIVSYDLFRLCMLSRRRR